MLRKETISSLLLNQLQLLMGIDVLNNHCLVGGTALALQIGHRISFDIDLFSNKANNYQQIEDSLSLIFLKNISFGKHINSPFGKGISVYLQGIKTDIIDWKSQFQYPIIEIDGLRIASKADIAGMKLDIITAAPEFARYDKKDYVDLACLLDEFSIEQMISIFKLRHPNFADPERIVIEGFQLAELADKKPDPKMLIDLPWNKTKAKIEHAVKNYITLKMKQ